MPLIYQRYIDDTYGRRNKNNVGTFFNSLDSYSQNMKLKTEVNPDPSFWILK